MASNAKSHEEIDREHMNEAVMMATSCKPANPSIPRVGAVIAVGAQVLGRGSRGVGKDGREGWHAEYAAFEDAKAREVGAQLPDATLYTTLEPCTRDSRSIPEECCTDLILQHRIKKVMIGILDPNPDITGKGMYKLQHQKTELGLFPHDLRLRIETLNAEFIRSQEAWGVEVISPEYGKETVTSSTEGKIRIRFKARRSPTDHDHVFTHSEGRYWPQPHHFANAGKPFEWDTTIHVGHPGSYEVVFVTVNDLGKMLVDFYFRVGELNMAFREKEKIPKERHGNVWVGIGMSGFPKGIRLDATWRVVSKVEPKAVATQT